MKRKYLFSILGILFIVLTTACDPVYPMTERVWESVKITIKQYLRDETNYNEYDKEYDKEAYSLFQQASEWMEQDEYILKETKYSFPGYEGDVYAIVRYHFDGKKLYENKKLKQRYDEVSLQFDLDNEFRVLKVVLCLQQGDVYDRYELVQ